MEGWRIRSSEGGDERGGRLKFLCCRWLVVSLAPAPVNMQAC